jgi:uncharacterized membrane protein
LLLFFFFLSFFFFFVSSFFKKVEIRTNGIVDQNKKKFKNVCVIEKRLFTLSQITCRLLKDFVLSWLRITTKPHQIKLHSFDGGALLFK